jgi:hypothetical protein
VLGGTRDGILATTLWLSAALILGHALQLSNGHYDPEALKFVVVALVAVAAGIVFPRFSDLRLGILGAPLPIVIAGGGLMLAFYHLATAPPTIELYRTSPEDMLPFRLGFAIVAVLGGLGLTRNAVLRVVWFPAAVLVFAILARHLLALEPSPHIDVWVVEKDAAAALLSGKNPYAITFPDPYGGSSPFFPPGVSVNGRLQFGFVYPPLCLLLCLPGYVLWGDPRYSMIFAMVGAALFMGYARPGNLGKIAALLFLFTPRSFFVLDRAWTDPFIVLLVAATVFLACRARKWMFVPLGLLFCLKQHTFIALPAAFMLLPNATWKERISLILKAGIVALAVTLPLALWNFHAFKNSVLDIREVFRMDSLGLLSHWARSGKEMSKWTGLIAIIPAAIIVLVRAPRTPSGFAAGNALMHFTLYIFSTHAFCNEYYNVIGSLFCAVAATDESYGEQAVPTAVPVPA